ncbi:hypothetical protein NYZ21_21110, partial [Acinetobacter baumannii]|nr:hypothetical protein [Acinetobacter baumannii]
GSDGSRGDSRGAAHAAGPDDSARADGSHADDRGGPNAPGQARQDRTSRRRPAFRVRSAIGESCFSPDALPGLAAR